MRNVKPFFLSKSNLNDSLQTDSILALSPVDGRYAHHTSELREVFSEYGLIRLRLHVEIEWLIWLASNPKVEQLPELSTQTCQKLRKIVENFSVNDASGVKQIERETNHDVKALEYFLKEKARQIPEIRDSLEFIHFGCTSYDINDNCFALMLKQARDTIIVPAIENLISILSDMAIDTAHIPMLGRTHGQPAAPTSCGKEFRVFAYRLRQQLAALKSVPINGKLSGAVGNFNSLNTAYPDIDWPHTAQRFVESLGLQYSTITTQTESHDYIAQYCHALQRINSIATDLCRDYWSYISIGYFRQKVIETEVGSSAMPHKVNPIDFENAEGNLGIANALLAHLADKLPISRWQRDLSDSTVLRNLGVPIGHCMIAYRAIDVGLKKLQVNEQKLNEDLDGAWETLSEAIQTVLRKHGSELPYEELKKLTRGLTVSKTDMQSFILKLQLPQHEKDKLLALTPQTYLGLAEQLAKSER